MPVSGVGGGCTDTRRWWKGNFRRDVVGEEMEKEKRKEELWLGLCAVGLLL